MPNKCYFALRASLLKIANNTKNKLNSDGHLPIAWEDSALKKKSNLVPNLQIKDILCNLWTQNL